MDVVTRADEDLLLELLNTTPVVDRNRVDELGDPAAGATWAMSRGGAGTAEEIAALREARDAIGAVVRGESDAQILDAHLGRITVRPALREGALAWTLQAASADETLSARAVLAWAALEERSPRRLRACANPECCLFLHDRSNANTARWCSMATCGNRAKARRHYQRQRADQ